MNDYIRFCLVSSHIRSLRSAEFGVARTPWTARNTPVTPKDVAKATADLEARDHETKGPFCFYRVSRCRGLTVVYLLHWFHRTRIMQV
jgi:hypothetical protein